MAYSKLLLLIRVMCACASPSCPIFLIMFLFTVNQIKNKFHRYLQLKERKGRIKYYIGLIAILYPGFHFRRFKILFTRLDYEMYTH